MTSTHAHVTEYFPWDYKKPIISLNIFLKTKFKFKLLSLVDTKMPSEVENTGSQARDFCMLERNFLSHVKLALLLAVLSWSILLKSRLVPGQPEKENDNGTPLSAVEYAASLACVIAGVWEYYKGYRDLRTSTPFFKGTKWVDSLSSTVILIPCSLHIFFMGVLSVVVFGTCIVLVIEESWKNVDNDSEYVQKIYIIPQTNLTTILIFPPYILYQDRNLS